MATMKREKKLTARLLQRMTIRFRSGDVGRWWAYVHQRCCCHELHAQWTTVLNNRAHSHSQQCDAVLHVGTLQDGHVQHKQMGVLLSVWWQKLTRRQKAQLSDMSGSISQAYRQRLRLAHQWRHLHRHLFNSMFQTVFAVIKYARVNPQSLSDSTNWPNWCPWYRQSMPPFQCWQRQSAALTRKVIWAISGDWMALAASHLATNTATEPHGHWWIDVVRLVKVKCYALNWNWHWRVLLVRCCLHNKQGICVCICFALHFSEQKHQIRFWIVPLSLNTKQRNSNC